MHPTTTVIMTVRNDAAGCVTTLRSLAWQGVGPDAIIVVDGGSSDGTVEAVRRCAARDARIRLIEAPGVNIARGRNIAAEAAATEVLAVTDAGCRADPDWLERLTRPFRTESGIDLVAGFYRIDPRNLFEEVVGLATMRGQLGPVDPERFNPSARSMACTRALWRRVGGWPDWIGFSEDTLFDHKVRRMDVGWRFVGDAIVHWRPRTSLRSLARQFFNYGTGRGHTQLEAGHFLYNLRNAALLVVSAAGCFVTPWAAAVAAVLMCYFYVWTFHGKGLRVARHTKRKAAYPLCLIVMWVVLFCQTAGYVVGSWQRWRSQDRYGRRTEAYLAAC